MVTLPSSVGIRHSILDLAPLELDCMNALWPRGAATVRDIQQALAPTRPRAYTTIMTILDRLAQKGIVQRHKAGRAWVYRPNVSEDEARSRAIAQLVEGFFDGSAAALTAHLSSRIGEISGGGSHQVERASSLATPIRSVPVVDAADVPPEESSSAGLETTLL